MRKPMNWQRQRVNRIGYMRSPGLEKVAARKLDGKSAMLDVGWNVSEHAHAKPIVAKTTAPGELTMWFTGPLHATTPTCGFGVSIDGAAPVPPQSVTFLDDPLGRAKNNGLLIKFAIENIQCGQHAVISYNPESSSRHYSEIKDIPAGAFALDAKVGALYRLKGSGSGISLTMRDAGGAAIPATDGMTVYIHVEADGAEIYPDLGKGETIDGQQMVSPSPGEYQFVYDASANNWVMSPEAAPEKCDLSGITDPVKPFSLTVENSLEPPVFIGHISDIHVATNEQMSMIRLEHYFQGLCRGAEWEINHKPDWMHFSISTGVLSGTPDAPGTFTNMQVSVRCGNCIVESNYFDIHVDAEIFAPQLAEEVGAIIVTPGREFWTGMEYYFTGPVSEWELINPNNCPVTLDRSSGILRGMLPDTADCELQVRAINRKGSALSDVFDVLSLYTARVVSDGVNDDIRKTKDGDIRVVHLPDNALGESYHHVKIQHLYFPVETLDADAEEVIYHAGHTDLHIPPDLPDGRVIYFHASSGANYNRVKIVAPPGWAFTQPSQATTGVVLKLVVDAAWKTLRTTAWPSSRTTIRTPGPYRIEDHSREVFIMGSGDYDLTLPFITQDHEILIASDVSATATFVIDSRDTGASFANGAFVFHGPGEMSIFCDAAAKTWSKRL